MLKRLNATPSAMSRAEWRTRKRRPITRSPGRGFSLAEALIALSITAVAGAVLLLSVESSLQTTTDAVHRTIADGVAQQILDEILTKQYVSHSNSGSGSDDPDPLGVLGPKAWELAGQGSERFDDIDDYAGYVAQPIQDAWGKMQGTGDDQGNPRLANFRVRNDYFQNWRQRILIYYVDPNDHTVQSSTPTAYRAIEVHVELVESNGAVIPLAKRKRIVAYIEPPP